MKKLLIVLFSVLLCCSLSARQHHNLVILHVNDTHSHLDPEGNGHGGIIERAAYVDSVRKAEGKNNVLLLHAGDYEQGTSYFNLLKGDLEMSLINALRYDCITIGNHEFDNGLEDLARRFSMVKCPIVCANYDFSNMAVGKYIKPYTIVRKAGMKIGIIGSLCNISTAVKKEIADQLQILNTLEILNTYAAYLKEEKGCDMVIVLSHMGYDSKEDKNLNDLLVASQLRNVDIIVGGHSHTRLDAATEVLDADKKPVLVVQDWNWGREVGKLTVR